MEIYDKKTAADFERSTLVMTAKTIINSQASTRRKSSQKFTLSIIDCCIFYFAIVEIINSDLWIFIIPVSFQLYIYSTFYFNKCFVGII